MLWTKIKKLEKQQRAITLKLRRAVIVLKQCTPRGDLSMFQVDTSMYVIKWRLSLAEVLVILCPRRIVRTDYIVLNTQQYTFSPLQKHAKSCTMSSHSEHIII